MTKPTRREVVRLNLSYFELDGVNRLAREAGLTRAGYLRSLIAKALGVPPQDAK